MIGYNKMTRIFIALLDITGVGKWFDFIDWIVIFRSILLSFSRRTPFLLIITGGSQWYKSQASPPLQFSSEKWQEGL